MKIYIAASSKPEERARVDSAFDMASKMGLEVIGDWRESVDKNSGNSDFDLSSATNDVDAVRKSDGVWLLIPEVGGRGCWIEYGIAIGWGKFTVVSGKSGLSVFMSLANIRSVTDFEGLAALVAQSRLDP